MRIRSLLMLVTTVVLVPGFLAAVMAVQKVRDGERLAALNALRETVRASALLVDGEIQRSIGALTALGASDQLRNLDWPAFYDQAAAIDQAPNVYTVLFDAMGHQVLNTSVPLGSPLPHTTAIDRVQQALTSGNPVISDVVVSPTGRLVTTLYVPSRDWGGTRYVVAQVFSVDHWRATALQVKNGSYATISVMDRQGIFISRNVNADITLGRPERPELVAAAAASSDGLIRDKTLEGVDAYDAFTHSEHTGWTVSVAVPVRVIERTATQAVMWLVAGGLLALMAAVLAAYYLGRTLVAVIDNVVRGARAVGAGQVPTLVHGRLEDANAIYSALGDAARVLSKERVSREAAEREREMLLMRETKLRERAQKENAAKDQFLALLGHELRNPLAAITGATAVLAHDRSSPEVRAKFLNIIQRQNRHLSHIVDDLLDVSRLMSGKIELERRRIDLAEWVTSCAEALRSTDKASKHEIVVRAEPVWIDGDGVRIEQIVNNLVFNSIKCAPPHSQISVQVRDAGDHAELTVQDFGMGISNDLLPRIFEPFVQGPPAPGLVSSGLGIGLALVRQLVLLHGGTVTVHSDGPDTGATFVVSFPKAPALVPPPPEQPRPSSGARHVMLVEDDADAMASMRELLQLMGHSVVTARNRDEAVACLSSHRVDLVLLDIGLPGYDGFQVATALRAVQGTAHLPIVALTGYGTESDRARTLAAGFDAHLSKPVDPDVLAGIIEQRAAVSSAPA